MSIGSKELLWNGGENCDIKIPMTNLAYGLLESHWFLKHMQRVYLQYLWCFVVLISDFLNIWLFQRNSSSSIFREDSFSRTFIANIWLRLFDIVKVVPYLEEAAHPTTIDTHDSPFSFALWNCPGRVTSLPKDHCPSCVDVMSSGGLYLSAVTWYGA